MCNLFSVLRRYSRLIIFPIGECSFYGHKCRVWSLFMGHLYVGRGIQSNRLIIEIV